MDLHTPVQGGNTVQHSPCAEVHSGSRTEPESPVPDHGSWGRGLVTSDWTEQSFLARLTLGDPQTPIHERSAGGPKIPKSVPHRYGVPSPGPWAPGTRLGHYQVGLTVVLGKTHSWGSPGLTTQFWGILHKRCQVVGGSPCAYNSSLTRQIFSICVWGVVCHLIL